MLTTLSCRLYPDELTYYRVYYLSPGVLGYGYLVLLKRTVGTLGYLITGVGIVDIHGNRPSVVRMTGRFMWVFVVPLSFIFDLFWLIGEETHQTLRDKTVGTYVIKKRAVPVGTGHIAIKIMSLAGLCLRLREVVQSSKPPEIAEDVS